MIRRHPNRSLLIAALVMLGVAIERLAMFHGRVHAELLVLQAFAALGTAAGLALLCPDMVQGDRWYRRGALALLVVSSLAFLLIFTKHGLLAFDRSS